MAAENYKQANNKQLVFTLFIVGLFTLPLMAMGSSPAVAAKNQLLTSELKTSQTTSELMSIRALRWQKRLILVNPTAQQQPQITAFANEFAEDIKERKVQILQQQGARLFVDIQSGQRFTWQNNDQLPIAAGIVWLIGLDGGVKSKSDISPTQLAALLWQIDRMPMRQRELATQK